MPRQFFKFNGGVMPADHKAASTSLPIAEFAALASLPGELVIPLQQGNGGSLRALVEAGTQVLKGQRIGVGYDDTGTAVHASTSGLVKAVEMRRMPHPSGLSALCVVIAPDGEERWITRTPFDYRRAGLAATRDYLRDAGVLVGGDFGATGQLATLVINGAESEPRITCDDMLMRERADGVIQGIAILREVLRASEVLIGIEDNQPEAIAAMRAALAKRGAENTQVAAVPACYPTGNARLLIRVLTGIEVPHSRRFADYGVECFDTSTAYAIYQAITLGQPMVSRIVTVAGNVERPRNIEAPLGVPLRALLALCGPQADTNRVIMGGPMMGMTMPGDEVPVVKTTHCVLAGSPALFPPPPPEMPCIRCGDCARACPADLQPFELYSFARARQFGKAQEYHLFDCIECGCCTYVCPSKIPLVDYYRFAKSEILARQRDQEFADAARERYQFRLLRAEREKQEKAARLATKAAAAHAPTAEDAKDAKDTKKALIAAAIARARQQKEQVTPANIDALTPEQRAEIAKIEARREALQSSAKTAPPQDE
ncbi:MAG: electron transport complex subunit RsxC [Betaproteobacteria bacterium]|nr:electron transport complex subunit RsxC [Betaproteobacteria bacterium]